MWDEDEYFNHESILIVTEEGALKRLKAPFTVFLIVEAEDLKPEETYPVTAVITNYDGIMMYAIGAQCYCYYWFIIL